MKKDLLLYTILLTGVFFSACKEEALIEYQGKNSIYFEGAYDETLNSYLPKNEGVLSFGYVDGLVEDSVYSIVVNSMGMPADIDRSYELQVVDTSTLKEEVDYQFINQSFAITAGKTQDTVRIKLLRNPRMAEQQLKLSLKLHANSHFDIGMPSEQVGTGNQAKVQPYNSFVLTVDDIVGCPWFWDPLLNKNASRIELYLGSFTPKKFQILLARYNLDVTTVTRPGYMPLPGQLIAWAFDMQSYLDEQEAKGETVYEADGKTPMKLGPAAK